LDNIKSKLLLGLLFGFVVVVGIALAADLNKVLGAVGAFQWGWLPLILGLPAPVNVAVLPHPFCGIILLDNLQLCHV